MDAWESIYKLLTEQRPSTGTYSVDVDGKRIPSMVPGNTQWLAPAIEAGYQPRISDEQLQRAIDYAIASGNYKSSDSPMSLLGSEFDLYNPSAAQRMNVQRRGYLIGNQGK